MAKKRKKAVEIVPENMKPIATKKKKDEYVKVNFKHTTFTETQKDFINKILNNDVTFVYGPAGCSKTYSTCYTALQMLQERKIKQIIITKPIQESGEKLGFLPGSLEEKVLPYLESFYGNIEKIIEKEDLKKLIEAELLLAKPLAYLRGATFDDCIMILDEAQNCDFRQLMLYLSRMGKNTKVIIAGDVEQSDVDENIIALPKFIEMVKNIKGISVHEFGRNDIVRNPLLIEITDRYSDWKKNNMVTPNKNGNGNGNGKYKFLK